MGLLIEDFFVLMTLVFSTGAFVSMGFSEGAGADPYEGSVWMQAVWILLYFVTLWKVFLRPAELLRMLLWQRMVVLLALLAVASTLWSVDPSTTARRSFAMVLTTVFGLFFATRYSQAQQLRMISRAMAVIAIASLFAGLLVPRIGIESGGLLGDWRGVFGFKNDLGRLMALSTVASFSLVIEDANGRLIDLAVAVLSFVLLILSRSTTSILVLFAVLMVAIFDRIVLRRLSRHQVASAVALLPVMAGIAIVAVMEGSGAFLQMLGKDRTLTGRTVLWGFILVSISHRPWTGFGYTAFWSGGEGALIRNDLAWGIFQAHNGYLQLALDVGLVGVGVFFLSCIPTMLKLMRPPDDLPEGHSRWPFLFLVFYLISNLTESSILVRNSIFWIIYLTTVCVAARIKSAQSLEPSRAHSVQAADVV